MPTPSRSSPRAKRKTPVLAKRPVGRSRDGPSSGKRAKFGKGPASSSARAAPSPAPADIPRQDLATTAENVRESREPSVRILNGNEPESNPQERPRQPAPPSPGLLPSSPTVQSPTPAAASVLHRGGGERQGPARASAPVCEWRNLAAINRRLANLEDKVADINKGLGTLTSVVTSVHKIVAKMSQTASEIRSTEVVESAPRGPAHQGKYFSKPKDQYKEIMMKRVPYLDIVFSSEQLARCLYNSFVTQVLEKSTDEGITPIGLDEVVGGLMFALGKTDKKDQYRRGHGPIASSLRRRTLTRALELAKRNTYDIFASGQEDSTMGADGDQECQRQPEWLTKRVAGGKPFVENRHIDIAQKRHESAIGDKSAFNRRMRVVEGGVPMRHEEAEFAMSTGYSMLLSHLNNARKYAPSEFWYVVGYLFVDWSAHRSVKMSADKVRLTWLGDADSAAAVKMSDLPKMVPSTAKDNSGTAKNEGVYKDFVRSRKELSMMVEHEVMVSGNCREHILRRRLGKEVRSWRRIINLVDAAAHVVKALCNFDKSVTIFDMLAYHKQSVPALYAIARVLRMMFSTRDTRSIAGPGREEDAGRETGDAGRSTQRTVSRLSADDKEALDSMFRRMQLPHSLMERVLDRTLCRVPETMFAAEHISTEADESGNGEDERQAGEGDGDEDDDFDTFEM